MRHKKFTMAHSSENSHFRSDIQGLRGIAVLLVVIYHSGLTLPGGAIGVDIFFVISGFVITGSIVRSWQENHGETSSSWGLRSFLIRRARRILPNYFVVLSLSVLVSSLFFDPYTELPQIQTTAIASLLFSANLHLFLVNSYDGLLEHPLRHLWSLGVEEHFYLFLAIVFVLILRTTQTDSVRKVRLLKSAMFLGAASLASSAAVAYSQVLNNWGLTSSIENGIAYFNRRYFSDDIFEVIRRLTFFLSPLRFWEILVGVVVALMPPRTKNRSPEVLVGSALLAVAVTATRPVSQLMNPTSAMIPVLAAATLIRLLPYSRLRGLLSNRTLVFFGNISYALYLWHWPIGVILKRVFEQDFIVASITVPTSVALAVLSTYTYERKFLLGKISLKLLLPFVLLALISTSVPSLLVNSEVIRSTLPPLEVKADNLASKVGCANSGGDQWEERCVVGKTDSKKSVYLYGDSNARSASTGLADLATKEGWRLTLGILADCPFLIPESTDNSCDRFNYERWEVLKKTPPDVLLVINHWTNHLDFTSDENGEGYLTQRVTKTLSDVYDLKIPVVVQYQIPICDFRNVLFPFRIFDGRWVLSRECNSFPIEESARRRIGSALNREIESCADSCLLVNLERYLCRLHCVPSRDGMNIFLDKSHISQSASLKSANMYRDAVNRLLVKQPEENP